MIAFGVPITDEEEFQRFAAPSIERHREPDSLVILKRGYDSVQLPYNEILEESAQHDDLEAVVLLHEDTTLDGPSLLEFIRWHFRDPRVGLLGTVGARGVSSMTWSRQSELLGGVRIAFYKLHLESYTTGPQLADMIDGYLMIVSPHVARSVRFDEQGCRDFHGYDVDFCYRVRARGYRIVIDDYATSHHSPGTHRSTDAYGRAYARWERVWNPARWPRQWRGSAPYGFFR